MSLPDLPSYDDVLSAAKQLKGQAVHTPLLESDLLNEAYGKRILVKAEVLQRTGSFKFRGAYNAISRLSSDERARGVLTYSSGNHAQGIALAAKLCGVKATIIMPEDAPDLKIQNTKDLGAEVIFYDRFGESREDIGQKLTEEKGVSLIKPYDNFHIIAGQGTCGKEIAEQCADLGVSPDAVIVPAGGGGLTAGICLAMEQHFPKTTIFTVEPEHFNDWQRSQEAGKILSNEPGHRSICDAILTPEPGEMTFALASPRLAGGLTVSDEDAKHAMREAFSRLKLVLEPGGAAALATALLDKVPGNPQTIVVIASGGNVDPAQFAEIVKA